MKDKGGMDISRRVLFNVKVNKQVNKCVVYYVHYILVALYGATKPTKLMTTLREHKKDACCEDVHRGSGNH